MIKPTMSQLRAANHQFFKDKGFFGTHKYEILNTTTGYELLTINRNDIDRNTVVCDRSVWYSINPDTLKLSFDRH